jgi:hypothetical protein
MRESTLEEELLWLHGPPELAPVPKMAGAAEKRSPGELPDDISLLVCSMLDDTFKLDDWVEKAIVCKVGFAGGTGRI